MNNYLRRARVCLAILSVVIITLLFLDFTGTIHGWFGWIAKIQLIPAILALNVSVVAGLIALTLIFGRLYCSIICPLGVFQDVIAKFNRKKNRYSPSPAINWLRYTVLALFIAALVAGIGSFVALLEPYSAYGRMVSNLGAPIYQWVNNLLAYIAERAESYAFYHTEVWVKGLGTMAIAVATLIAIVVLAWRGGRTYCNTVCPVGTLLGFVSRFSLLKHRISTDKCNNCGLCARNCKASCIDSKNHTIDYTRCVTCFDCIGKCKHGAIRYGTATVKNHSSEQPEEGVNASRRGMLTILGTLMATSVVRSQQTKVDGGLAFIEDKKRPKRQTRIVPAGAYSARHFAQHCTGCQLCVSVCENQVLRPSTDLLSFMQPEMSYERGYCRPECTRCSEVCPTGAIVPITTADKSATQIGHAVWVEKNCVVLTDGVKCGNCARHCPAGAITMITHPNSKKKSHKVPMIDTERCIGCGACENLCPSRPFSAIYVEGHITHRTV